MPERPPPGGGLEYAFWETVWWNLRWRFLNKTVVSVKWPIAAMKYGNRQISVHDPYPIWHYQRWLDENVGLEDKDWTWDTDYDSSVDRLINIHLHNKHAHQAPMIKLMWG